MSDGIREEDSRCTVDLPDAISRDAEAQASAVMLARVILGTIVIALMVAIRWM